jgi:site-specific DNA-adenine methylase
VIKYPGSKHIRRHDLAERMERLGPTNEYREPFLGGASVALAFLERNPHINKVWLNDLRPELIAVWRAVRDYPDEFGEELSQHPSPHTHTSGGVLRECRRCPVHSLGAKSKGRPS